METKTAYKCDVCDKFFFWNNQSSHIMRGCGSGYAGYDFTFVMCDNKCFQNSKNRFVKKLGKEKGWTEKSAAENYYNTIQINKVLKPLIIPLTS